MKIDKTIFGGLALFLAFVGSAVLVTLAPKAAARRQPAPKRYQKTLAEGVTVNRHGICGIDFLRLGSARVEKVRKGPLTFGAFNVLLLKDLEVVIPEDASPALPAPDGAKPRSARDAAEARARRVLSDMGVGEGFLLSSARGARFSTVRIDGLAVARQSGTNAVPLFAAKYGATGRDGFLLDGCVVFDGGATNRVGDAQLCMDGETLRLVWRAGALDILPRPETVSQPETTMPKETNT